MAISSLFIPSTPLLVMPRLAEQLGIHKAAILQQIIYWQDKRTNKNFVDGHYWVYNTYEEWSRQLPWMSVSSIKRHILALEKAGYLISANHNRNVLDRTKWYRVDQERMRELEDRRTDQIGLSMGSNRSIDPNTETTTKKNIDRAPPDPVVDKFEEFWKSYPRKIAKSKCRQIFMRATKKTDPTILLEAIKAQIHERTMKKNLGAFIPEWAHPTTWLNGERWNDEIQSPENIKLKATTKPVETRSNFACQNIPSLQESRALCDSIDAHNAEVNLMREERERQGLGPMKISELLKSAQYSQTMLSGELR